MQGEQFVSRPVFRSELVKFGKFRCSPNYESFHDTGPSIDPIIVFPRIPVEIEQADRDPVIADPNVAMMYNRGQAYRRRALCSGGDRCEWFAFRQDMIHEFMDNASEEKPEGLPFDASHVPVSSRIYWLQRLVYRYVTELKEEAWDRLWIQETCLSILEQVLSGLSDIAAAATRSKRRSNEKRKIKIFDCLQILSVSFHKQVSLSDLSQQVDLSPFHLCRVFRQMTGVTIHQYINNLRLRTSLNRLPDHRGQLTRLALELGFSSHSHFSSAFGRTFGMAPSAVQDADIARLKAQNSKNLKAANRDRS